MVVLADSSAWIDALNQQQNAQTFRLGRASAANQLVVGDLVLMEVLQGLREERRFLAARKVLGHSNVVGLCGPEIAVRAAANYRLLRQRGVTVRGTVDVIIATWCIENDAMIIHNDRDLKVIESELGLVAYT